MDKSNKKSENETLWIGFFLIVGIQSLLCFNTVLNLGIYFDEKISDGFFTYISFGFTFANIMSFLSSRYIFKNLSSRKMILYLSCVSVFSFILLGICIEMISNILFNQIFSIFMILICGYSIGSFQGRCYGIASSMGEISISKLNFGSTFAGIGLNIIGILFGFIFPKDSKDSSKALRNQLICYIVLIILILFLFIFILKKFLRKYGHLIDDLDAPGDMVRILSETQEEISKESDLFQEQLINDNSNNL